MAHGVCNPDQLAAGIVIIGGGVSPPVPEAGDLPSAVPVGAFRVAAVSVGGFGDAAEVVVFVAECFAGWEYFLGYLAEGVVCFFVKASVRIACLGHQMIVYLMDFL